MIDIGGVLAAVRAERDWIVSTMEDLIGHTSIAGRPSRIHEPVEAVLAAQGMHVERIRTAPERLRDDPEYSPVTLTEAPPNLIAALDDAPISTTLFAHLDTEPIHEAEAWAGDPTRARIDGRRLYGLGSADDKAGVVMVLAAVRVLQRLAVPVPGLHTAFVHAKGGGAAGALPVWRELADRPAADGAAALYCHPAETGRGLRDLKAASRGLLEVRFVVNGRSPEPREERTPASADPREGVNAFDLADLVIGVVRSWSRKVAPRGTLVALTAIEAGDGTAYLVPDRCTFRMAIWFTEGRPQDMLASLRAHIAAHAPADGRSAVRPMVLEAVGLRAAAARTDGRSSVARMARAAIRDVTGEAPQFYRGHAASDIRFPIRCAGMPAVGFGPVGGGFYGPSEWVDLDSLESAITALTLALLRLRR